MERAKPSVSTVLTSDSRIDLSKEIKSRDIQTKIMMLTLIVALITLLVYILPIPTYVNSLLNSFNQPKYHLNIQDGDLFKFPPPVMEDTRYIYIEQNLDVSVKGDKVIFSHKIRDRGQNYLSGYSDHILIVDPLGHIRGELTVPVNNAKQEEKFKTIFNLPPSNEKLYGTWDMYSYINAENKTYALLKMPFEVMQTEPWYLRLLPVMLILALLLLQIVPRMFRPPIVRLGSPPNSVL